MSRQWLEADQCVVHDSCDGCRSDCEDSAGQAPGTRTATWIADEIEDVVGRQQIVNFAAGGDHQSLRNHEQLIAQRLGHSYEVADDYVDTHDVRGFQFWGSDDDGDHWRVHLVRSEASPFGDEEVSSGER